MQGRSRTGLKEPMLDRLAPAPAVYGGAVYSRPSSLARATAWVRLDTSSLR
jgi:hypothetical protein